MKQRIFLPNPTNPKPSTLGDRWFLAKKHWKLAALLGYSGYDEVLTTRGLSFFCMLQKSYDYVQNEILPILDKNGIQYRTEFSEAGWHYRVIISGRKKNLEIIDKMYAKYYRKTIKELRKAGYIKEDGWFYEPEYFESLYDEPFRVEEKERILANQNY